MALSTIQVAASSEFIPEFKMSWKLVAGLMVLFVSGAGAPTYVRAAELDSFRDANAALRNGLENGKPPPNMSDPAYAEQVSLAFNLAITEIARGKSISDIL